MRRFRHLAWWLGCALAAACSSKAQKLGDFVESTLNGTSGSGSGSSGSGGAGGAGSGSCGNGVVDPGEACDAGAESADCDADCTKPMCGDGLRNAAAGEGCDDGNTADKDACGPDCKPTVFALEPPFSSNGSSYAEVVAAGDRFAVAWSRLDGAPPPAKHAVFDAKGKAVVAPSIIAPAAPAVLFGGGPARGMIDWLDGTSLGYRFTGKDGALEPATLASAGANGFYGAPGLTGSGNFCIFASTGDVRCTGAGDALGAVNKIAVTSPNDTYGVKSSAILAVGSGAILAYTVTTASLQYPVELRLRTIAADGKPLTPELPLVKFAGYSESVAGGSVQADGSFGFALWAGGTVTWYPAPKGQLDVDHASILKGMTTAAVVGGHPSGKFVLAWMEKTSVIDMNQGKVIDTCALNGRAFSAAGDPLGDVFPIYKPGTQGDCAHIPSVALDAAGDLMAAWGRIHDQKNLPFPSALEAIIVPGALGKAP